LTEAYFERTNNQNGYFFLVNKIFEMKSKFQNIVIGDSPLFGKCLFLDGLVQFTEKDEFIYHESAVQPGIHLLDGVKNALILGGGDGFVAREFLKHDDVEKVIIIDIDQDVFDLSKKYFSDLNDNVFENPKLEIKIMNAFKYINETEDKFDYVILDLTDVAKLGERFYSKQFFEMCKKVMSDKSIFSTHAGTISMESFISQKLFKKVDHSFNHTSFYYSEQIPSFNGQWGYIIGSENIDIDKPNFEKIKSRYEKIKDKLKYYDPEIHKAMFHKPKWLIDSIENAEDSLYKEGEGLGGALINSDSIPKF